MRKIDWKAHFANHAKSGLGVTEYCRQNRLSASQWYAKRRKLMRSDPQEFVPVSIKTSQVTKELSLTVAIDADGFVEFSGRASHPEFMKMLLGKGTL